MQEKQRDGRRDGRGHRRTAAVGLTAIVLAAATAGTAAHAAGGPTASTAAWNRDGDTQKSLTTRPTFHPERVWVTKKAAGASTSDIFVAPKRTTKNWQTGPMILDGNGRLRWYKPMSANVGAYDFRTQTYAGRPVLTWWQGASLRGYGEGEGVIYDEQYRPVATVKAGNGLKMDLHEFHITPEGTALIIAYKVVRGDTRSRRGGRKNGLVHDNYVQEVDIATGKVLMQWDAGKDIAYTESYNTVPEDPTIPYDYMHLNAVNITADGNLIVSARATHAYYKLDRKTGKLLWRMGGRKSDFRMGKGSRTAFQHDVHALSATRYTAFDNNADKPRRGLESRGVILRVDEAKRTVDLERSFTHPTPILGASQGNMQTLPNGNEFVGWGGSRQNFTEFDAKGNVVFDAKFISSKVDTYRAYRADWTGRPVDQPLLTATRKGANTVVRMSWNGATEVASWRVLAGPTDTELTQVASFAWRDLETGATAKTTQPRLQVEAVDAAGTVLGRSAVVGVTR